MFNMIRKSEGKGIIIVLCFVLMLSANVVAQKVKCLCYEDRKAFQLKYIQVKLMMIAV
jgi:hypothetical protein